MSTITQSTQLLNSLTNMATKRNDTTVKIDSEVASNARIAAEFKGLTLAEYLTETLRPIVLKDMEAGYQARLAKPRSKDSKK